ncbi:hypothetical protein B0H14DRAFT_3438227 [Mycena olivaceomarginata]|nr:hypothetical protein B0H14DRAFT_3438227 [Mycena olivaceomarginata]
MIASYLLNIQTRRQKDHNLEQNAEARVQNHRVSDVDNSNADDADVAPRSSVKRKNSLLIDLDDSGGASDEDLQPDNKEKSRRSLKRKSTEDHVDASSPK